MNILRITCAYLIKAFHTGRSYRFNLYTRWISMLFSLTLFYFFARALNTTDSPLVAEAGGDYFSYVLVGMILMYFLNTAMSCFATEIRSGQVSGTLESMIASPASFPALLAGSALYKFTLTGFRAVGFIILSVFMLKVDMGQINLGITLSVLLLSVLTFSALGLLSAAFVLAFKRGDPVSMLINITSVMLGGVLFPVSVLPGWLQGVSQFIPMKYATRTMRRAMLQDTSWQEVQGDLLVLLICAAVLLPLAGWTFNWGFQKARRDGTLGQF